jgi:hypothetical protein
MDFPFDEVLSHELVPSGLYTISPPLISLSDTTQGGAMAACLITDKTRSVTSADPEGSLKQDTFFCNKREYPLASSGLGLEEPKKFKKVSRLFTCHGTPMLSPMYSISDITDIPWPVVNSERCGSSGSTMQSLLLNRETVHR